MTLSTIITKHPEFGAREVLALQVEAIAYGNPELMAGVITARIENRKVDERLGTRDWVRP